MRGIVAPMIGGMITALVLPMFVVPVARPIVRRTGWNVRVNAGAR